MDHLKNKRTSKWPGPGDLYLLRQVEKISRVEHGGSPEIKMCSKGLLQRVLSALSNKRGGRHLSLHQQSYYSILL